MTRKKKDKTSTETKNNDNIIGSDGLFLSKEQRLEIAVSHLEREVIKKEIQSMHNKISYLERDKVICNLQMSDLKARSIRKDRDHKDLIESIGRKLGVDLRNSLINPESGEVTLT